MNPKNKCAVIFLILLVVALCSKVARADMTEIRTAAASAGRTYNLNPKLILAVIEVESRFDQFAVGSLGEIGLLQLRPEFHECASFDIATNIDCGARYLAELRKQCSKDCDRFGFVTSFNTGPGSVIRKHESDYYKKVLRAFNKRGDQCCTT